MYHDSSTTLQNDYYALIVSSKPDECNDSLRLEVYQHQIPHTITNVPIYSFVTEIN